MNIGPITPGAVNSVASRPIVAAPVAPQPEPTTVYNGSVEAGRSIGADSVVSELRDVANENQLQNSYNIDSHFLSKTVNYTWVGTSKHINNAYDELNDWIDSQQR